MIHDFIEQAMTRARYKKLADGTHYASVPRLRGVWVNAPTLAACRRELREVIEEWLLFKVYSRESVPGFSFSPDARMLAHA
jgi:predicted RNase H-like HicB family nuclease